MHKDLYVKCSVSTSYLVMGGGAWSTGETLAVALVRFCEKCKGWATGPNKMSFPVDVLVGNGEWHVDSHGQITFARRDGEIIERWQLDPRGELPFARAAASAARAAVDHADLAEEELDLDGNEALRAYSRELRKLMAWSPGDDDWLRE